MVNRPTPPYARPRLAAALIALRVCNGKQEVLLGRRDPGARFMPGKYVFPGGRISIEDRRPWCFEPDGAPASPPLREIKAGARAAIRELYEETGLLIGQKRQGQSVQGNAARAIETAFIHNGVWPELDGAAYIARAITPKQSLIRFNTLFYLVTSDCVQGRIRSNGELVEIDWYDVSRCDGLDMADVTRFMLSYVVDPANRASKRKPLYCYRLRIPRVLYRAE